MLFYSYAELVVGLIAVFYFTSKVFSIIKYKMYFALSLIFIILTASVACFLKDEQQYVILPVLDSTGFAFYCINISSSFTRTQQKDNVNILFLVFFRIDIFYLFHKSISMFNFTYRVKLSKLCRL